MKNCIMKVTKRQLEKEIVFCKKIGYKYLIKYSYSDSIQGLYHIANMSDLLDRVSIFAERNQVAKIEIINVDEAFEQMQ